MSALERLTHILLITVSVVALATLIENRYALKRTQPPARHLVGTSPLKAVGPDWKQSSLNAVLFIGTHCQYCESSTPFYRRISEVRIATGSHVKLSVLSLEPVEDVKTFLAREHIYADGVYQIPRISGLAGTPTLLFLDSSGVVTRAFEGQLDSARELEVLEIVRTARFARV